MITLDPSCTTVGPVWLAISRKYGSSPLASAARYSARRGVTHLANRSSVAVGAPARSADWSADNTRQGTPNPKIHTGMSDTKSGAARAKALAMEGFLQVGAALLRLLERLIVRASLVETTPFLSASHFPWARELEANWKTIRRELDDVLAYRDDLPNFQDISTDQV